MSNSQPHPTASLKKSITLAVLFSFVLTATPALANSFLYAFSYTTIMSDYLNPTVDTAATISGTFEGSPNGNLIENVTNPTLSINGYTVPSPVFAGHYDGNTLPLTLGNATVSFDGTGANFLFNDGDYFQGGGNYTASFQILPFYGVSAFFILGSQSNLQYLYVNNETVNSSWTVTQVGGPLPEPVPEGTPTLVFVLTLISLGWTRGRAKGTRQTPC